MAEAIPQIPPVENSATKYVVEIIGRNPETWGAILLALVVVLVFFIILFLVYLEKYNKCSAKSGMLGTNPLGNLNTGSNNPMWEMQMGDAGWGGPMHSTYQKGQPRVWGASADGGHDMTTVPVATHGCGYHNKSPMASEETQALVAAQAFAPAGTAKGMSDNDLRNVMSGVGV